MTATHTTMRDRPLYSVSKEKVDVYLSIALYFRPRRGSLPFDVTLNSAYTRLEALAAERSVILISCMLQRPARSDHGAR